MVKERLKLKRRAPKPVDVELTLKMNFGESRDDAITVIDNRRVPMVGSVFRYRDKIVRAFALLLVKTGMAQPRVAKELFPLLNVLKRDKDRS